MTGSNVQIHISCICPVHEAIVTRIHYIRIYKPIHEHLPFILPGDILYLGARLRSSYQMPNEGKHNLNRATEFVWNRVNGPLRKQMPT